MYLSSADMMQRNLDRRVEIAFPIEDEKLKNELKRTLFKASLRDNVKGRELNPDMTYSRINIEEGAKKISSQDWLMEHTIKASGIVANKV